MKRCTNCFRFHPGSPTYCAHCGRSFDVRLCARGHRNPRHAEYCSECGSAELSTPGPPASLLHRVSGIVLYAFACVVLGVVLLAVVLESLRQLEWSAIGGPLVSLVLMFGVLYWTTTLLPGPVKKIGKAAGRRLAKSMRKGKHE